MLFSGLKDQSKFQLEEVRVTTDPKNIVVYIHGTFAPRARWTEAGSTLSRILLQAVDRLSIYRFVWTGRNSMEHRRVAGQRLQESIARLLEEFPSARFYMVAHSHGGNVALYALGDSDCAARVAGLVCMATPFLHLQPNRLDSTIGLTKTLITLPVFLALCAAAAASQLGFWVEMPLGLCILGLARRLTRRVADRWRASAFKALGRYQLPRVETNVLIVRSAGDEASLALASSSFAGWIVAKAIEIATGPVRILSTVAGMLVLPVFLTAGIHWGCALLLAPLALVAAPFFAAEILLSYATTVLMIPLLLVVGLVSRAYTPWLLVHSHLLDFSAESVPPGAWELVILPARVRTTFGVYWPPGDDHVYNPPHSRFIHSGIYEHPQAIQLIVDWVTETSAMAHRGSPRWKYVWDDNAPHSWPVWF